MLITPLYQRVSFHSPPTPRASVFFFFLNVYFFPLSRCVTVTGADKQSARSNYLARDCGGYLASSKQPELLDVCETHRTR